MIAYFCEQTHKKIILIFISNNPSNSIIMMLAITKWNYLLDFYLTQRIIVQHILGAVTLFLHFFFCSF